MPNAMELGAPSSHQAAAKGNAKFPQTRLKGPDRQIMKINPQWLINASFISTPWLNNPHPAIAVLCSRPNEAGSSPEPPAHPAPGTAWL